MEFEQVIKSYLDKLSKEDKLFAKVYAKSNKNLEECINFIKSEAEKRAKNGRCLVMTDEEVYGLAVHYYDEDEIVVKPSTTKIVALSDKPKRERNTKSEKTPKAVENNGKFDIEFPIF